MDGAHVGLLRQLTFQLTPFLTDSSVAPVSPPGLPLANGLHARMRVPPRANANALSPRRDLRFRYGRAPRTTLASGQIGNQRLQLIRQLGCSSSLITSR